ncbi:MAG: hypothetical protein EBQ92_13915 [Proteobacteria bacterium]|nr:hypothetical protein [Pseudomonadota bacterium]
MNQGFMTIGEGSPIPNERWIISMEKRATILSIGLSFLAMYLVWQYISGEDERLKSEYQVTENIVVAKRDILQYETIRPTDITLLTVPAKFLPPGRIGNQEDVYDSVAAIPISKGEFILDNKIISKKYLLWLRLPNHKRKTSYFGSRKYQKLCRIPITSRKQSRFGRRV